MARGKSRVAVVCSRPARPQAHLRRAALLLHMSQREVLFAMLDDERSTWVTPGEDTDKDGPKAPGEDTGEDGPKAPRVLLPLINRLHALARGHDPRSRCRRSPHGRALCLGATRHRWRRTPSPGGCGSRERGRGDGAPGGHGLVRSQRAGGTARAQGHGGVAWRWLAARVHVLVASMGVGTCVVRSVYLPIGKGVEVLHVRFGKGLSLQSSRSSTSLSRTAPKRRASLGSSPSS
jgi:hypothetical protein